MNLTDYLEAVNNSELVKRAKAFASEKHSGQTRKGGGDYFSHPRRVAAFVAKNKQSHKLDNLVAAAYCHDTVEDCNVTIEEIREKFGELVANLVEELTSDKEKLLKMGKTEYLTDKMLHMSSWGLVIKLCDRLDNVSDLLTADAKFRDKYKKETEAIIKGLLSQRELTTTHRKLIHQIQKKLSRLEKTEITE